MFDYILRFMYFCRALHIGSQCCPGVDRKEGLYPLVWYDLSCHTGGHAVKDGCQADERGM